MPLLSYNDKRLWELYEQERDKGSSLIDIEEDYKALSAAMNLRIIELKDAP